MNPIQVLLPQVANQIAAGEVVERPASIVKELVENSIDAGATVINIDIGDGGKELIRIRDNGSGIPKEQLDLALAPHATSKLRAIDDLDNLISYGFRGEALASISSVSKLTLTSRTADDVAGWQIYNEGKEYRTKSEPVAHNKGTTINVAELFYNTPARKKFLKSGTVEFNYIEDLVRRMAIVRPNVEWTLSHNGKQKFRFKGLSSEQFLERIQQVHPRSFTEDTISIKAQTKTFDMQMELVIEPFNGMQTKTNCIQYSYINNRMIKDKVIISAMKQALSELFNFVNYNYVLFLTIDPHAVDINVHPAKAEVRFVDAHKVHSFIFQNVFLQLSRQNGINSQFVDNILLRTNLDSSLIDQEALEAFTSRQQRLQVPTSRLAGKEPENVVSTANSSSFDLRDSLAQAQKTPSVREIAQASIQKNLLTNLSSLSTPDNTADEVEFEGIKSFTDPRLQQAAEEGELPSFNTQPQAKSYSSAGFSFNAQPSYAERTGSSTSNRNTTGSFGFGGSESARSSSSLALTTSNSNFGASFGGRAPQQGSSLDSLKSLLGENFLAQARAEINPTSTNSANLATVTTANAEAAQITSAQLPELDNPNSSSTTLATTSPQFNFNRVSQSPHDSTHFDAQKLEASLAEFNQEFSNFAHSAINQDLNLDTITPPAATQEVIPAPTELSGTALLDSILEADSNVESSLDYQSNQTTPSTAGIISTVRDTTGINSITATSTSLTTTVTTDTTVTTTCAGESTADSATEVQLSRAFIARDYLSHYLDLRQQQEFLYFLNQILPATLSTANQVQTQFAQPRLEAQFTQQLEASLGLTDDTNTTATCNAPSNTNCTLAPLASSPAPSDAQLQQVIQAPSLAQQALSNGNAPAQVPSQILNLQALCSFSVSAFQEEILSCVTQRQQAREQLLHLGSNNTTLAGLAPNTILRNPTCAWLDHAQDEQMRVLSIVNSMCVLQYQAHVLLVAQTDLLELMQTIVHQHLENFQASFAVLQLEARATETTITEEELTQAQLALNNLEILDLWCNSELKKFALPEVFAYNLEMFTRLGLFQHGAYMAELLSTKAQPLL